MIYVNYMIPILMLEDNVFFSSMVLKYGVLEKYFTESGGVRYRQGLDLSD